MQELGIQAKGQSMSILSFHNASSFAPAMVFDQPLIIAEPPLHRGSLNLFEPLLEPCLHLSKVLPAVDEVAKHLVPGLL